MILLTTYQIKDIAGELDCGFNCFINKKTREVISLIGDADDFYDPEEDAWADDRKKVEENPDDYLAIEKMESRESFGIMAGFAEIVDSISLRNRLIYALNQKKPFSKFKYIIDNSGDYRQKWFDFKDEAMQEWVKEQIDSYNLRLTYDDSEDDDE